jgi:two-component sensor histidine kinase
MLNVHLTPEPPPHGAVTDRDFLTAEIRSLRRLLAEAESDAKTRFKKAQIEAREREAVGRLQKLILEELHHRIKNTLATVGAIVSQSLRNVPEAEGAGHAISGRLLALGHAHDLLLQAKLSSTDLRTVIRRSIQAFDTPDETRFSICGSDVLVTPDAIIAVAMTLNELCTNALKFGALSVPEGRVDLLWTVDPQTRHVHFAWTEKHGPAVQEPASRNFGTRLLETLGTQIRGEVQLTYASSGFSYTFDAPIAVLNSPVRPTTADSEFRCR